MGKIAFVFPGQGAQYAGMGKAVYDSSETAAKVYEIASKAAGFDVAELCFTENSKLSITEYTQIALLATEVAILKVVEEAGIKPDICAGLSLGEYGALAAGNVMDLEDLFSLIRKRGIYMQQEYPEGGAMAAVLGLDAETVSKICGECSGIVAIANDNCPGQVVISGEAWAVQAASVKLAEAGAKRCIPLNVSGPFHSALLAGAGKKLAAELENVEIRKPEIPYVCNLEAAVVTGQERIKELLEKQVSGTVRFRESIETMIKEGVDTFVEIGPGRTLSGFVRKTDKSVKVYNVETPDDLNKLKDALGK